MLDFTFILLLSLGTTTAKTDLNSHQPYSNPVFFTEASLRLQKSNLGYFGFRTSYYNIPLKVRPIFQDKYGESYQVRDLGHTLFIGKGVRLNPENYLSVDGGFTFIPKNTKWGAQARLRYTQEYTTRREKNYNLSASLGMDYWMQDNFDDYEDVTTLDADFLFHLTIGVEIPLNPRLD